MIRPEALVTVVFELTSKGAEAMKSAGDEVPRRLRTLLSAIDGQSTVAQYTAGFPALAPILEEFTELEALGYLQRQVGGAFYPDYRAAGAQKLEPSSQQPRTRASDPVPSAAPLLEAELRALAGNIVAQPRSSVISPFELELQALARQMAGDAEMAVPAPAPAPARQPSEKSAALASPNSPDPRHPELPDLQNEVEKFLKKSAGAEALPLILILDQIKTLDQFRAELPSYITLVKRYGPEAEQHIQRITDMLDLAGR